jgi:hypothetical protein
MVTKPQMRPAYAAPEDLFLKTPLYQELAIENSDAVVREILNYAGTFDTYCPGCSQSATFRGNVTKQTADIERQFRLSLAVPGGVRYTPWRMREITKSVDCTRKGHILNYYFICETDYLIKVGQYPSAADIEKGDTEKYKVILGRDRLQELNRAIGLTAHGVGIGAHTYLRRIFESLVEEAHQSAKGGNAWDEEKYTQSRMAEKIKLLKGSLPDFLVENPRLYSILSSGIHELTEQTCLANFEALKLCIEVILDQKLKESHEKEKREAARQALARIDGKG